jgi:hypothetical protein
MPRSEHRIAHDDEHASDEPRHIFVRRRVVMSRSVASRSAASAAAIVALAIVAIVLPPDPARSQQEITPVEVVNTPLPVEALEPLKVDISGVPTVDLDGTPSVQVAPVEPFQVSRQGIFLPADTEISASFDVPEESSSSLSTSRRSRISCAVNERTSLSRSRRTVRIRSIRWSRSPRVDSRAEHDGRVRLQRAHQVLRRSWIRGLLQCDTLERVTDWRLAFREVDDLWLPDRDVGHSGTTKVEPTIEDPCA